MLKPIEFIEALKKSDDYIEIIYTNGGCYQFSKILKLLYKNAKAYKVKTNQLHTKYCHIITEINGKYYDATGEVRLEDYFGYEVVTEKDIPELEKWSFCKTAWLSKSCPYCGEDMIYERDAV